MRDRTLSIRSGVQVPRLLYGTATGRGRQGRATNGNRAPPGVPRDRHREPAPPLPRGRRRPCRGRGDRKRPRDPGRTVPADEVRVQDGQDRRLTPTSARLSDTSRSSDRRSDNPLPTLTPPRSSPSCAAEASLLVFGQKCRVHVLRRAVRVGRFFRPRSPRRAIRTFPSRYSVSDCTAAWNRFCDDCDWRIRNVHRARDSAGDAACKLAIMAPRWAPRHGQRGAFPTGSGPCRTVHSGTRLRA